MKNKSAKTNNIRKHSEKAEWIYTRREFLINSSLLFAGYSASSLYTCANSKSSSSPVRFGIVTDSHYAKTDNKNNRYYRESIKKMTECVELMNEKKVDFLIELGDFKDQDNSPTEKNTLNYLKTIEEVFQGFKGNKYHVLGNHDVDSITKNQFLTVAINTNIFSGLTYYSFDNNWVHFMVLDANFKSDGINYNSGNFDWQDTNIPIQELQWLKKDLAATSKPVIVFIHQNLDGSDDYCVRNSGAVRQIIQNSKKVLAVFQGHKHSGGYNNIESIHYYTLKAMVEGSGDNNNSYAIVEIHEDHSLVVTGYRKALSQKLEKV